MDALLNGGLQVGAISECTGNWKPQGGQASRSCLLPDAQEGQVCVPAVASDAFDTESSATSGGLKQLLSVRHHDESAPDRTVISERSPTRRARQLTQLDRALRPVDVLRRAGGFL